MQGITLACSALLISGCFISSDLSTQEMRASADVTVLDPAYNGEMLRIPLKVERTGGDSASFLRFSGKVKANQILITARKEIGRTEPPTEVQISAPNLPPGQYKVIYKGPDDAEMWLRDVNIRREAGAENNQP